MATTTGPDLSVARSAVEALMDDTCVIYAPDDAGVLDEESGELLATDTVLYEGRCKVTPKGDAYSGSLPVDGVPELPDGSRWVMTSTRNDPLLDGKVFNVTGVTLTTFAVSRRVTLELR